jgi:hypothetical protein
VKILQFDCYIDRPTMACASMDFLPAVCLATLLSLAAGQLIQILPSAETSPKDQSVQAK